MASQVSTPIMVVGTSEVVIRMKRISSSNNFQPTLLKCRSASTQKLTNMTLPVNVSDSHGSHLPQRNGDTHILTYISFGATPFSAIAPIASRFYTVTPMPSGREGGVGGLIPWEVPSGSTSRGGGGFSFFRLGFTTTGGGSAICQDPSARAPTRSFKTKV